MTAWICSNRRTKRETASLLGGSGAFFTWDAILGAVGYRVYYGPNGGPPYASDSGATPLTTTNYTPAGLVSGTTYYWRVVPIDESGLEGQWSAQHQKVAP